MNPANLLRLDIVVERRSAGAPDGMGDPGDDLGAPITYKGWIWQDSSSEETANTAVTEEQFRMTLERRAAGLIDAGDQVSHGGVTYEVFGPPWTVTNPRTTAVEFVYATLRRTA